MISPEFLHKRSY